MSNKDMICTVNDCGKTRLVRGLCPTHHYQMQKNGRIVSVRGIQDKRPAIIKGDVAKIPLGVNAKHGYAIVDKKYARLDKYNWTIKKHDMVSYAITTDKNSLNGLHIKMQWLVLPRRDGFIVDHKDGNGLNNRAENLRYATKQQNQFNLPRNSANTSGYMGVSYRKDIKKWGVRVRHEGRYISLGAFKTPLEASKVREAWVIKNRGEFARLGQ